MYVILLNELYTAEMQGMQWDLFFIEPTAINHSLAWILREHLTSAGYIVRSSAPVTSTPSVGTQINSPQ